MQIPELQLLPSTPFLIHSLPFWFQPVQILFKKGARAGSLPLSQVPITTWSSTLHHLLTLILKEQAQNFIQEAGTSLTTSCCSDHPLPLCQGWWSCLGSWGEPVSLAKEERKVQPIYCNSLQVEGIQQLPGQQTSHLSEGQGRHLRERHAARV